MEASADLMKKMNKMMKVEEVSSAMQKLSEEMTKAGVIEEMMDGAFEMMDDDDEEEAEVTLEQIFAELNIEAFSDAKSVGIRNPGAQADQQAANKVADIAALPAAPAS